MCVCLRNLAGDLVRAEGGEGGGAAGDVCCGFPDPTGCRELLRYAPSPATSASRASGRSEGEGGIGPTVHRAPVSALVSMCGGVYATFQPRRRAGLA